VPSDESPDHAKRKRASCAIEEELRAFVAPRQSCQSAADCSNIAAPCPFGCVVPVARSSEREVKEMIARLGERQDKEGMRCLYKCAALKPPVCAEGRCAER